MTEEAIKETIYLFRKHRRFEEIIPEMYNDVLFRNAILQVIQWKQYPFPEYASWIAQHFFKQHPECLLEWIPFIKDLLLRTENHAVQRNLTHVFINDRLPIDEDGALLKLFLSFLENPDSLPALKYSAFRAIEKQYFHMYPELIPEVGHLLFLHQEDRKPSIESMRSYYRKKYNSFTHA
jgi:hypothetical protein